jgi:hypothetical protein
MKTLTLTQPWASLVAAGMKKWETRSWSTKYRGPLAIHAAKGYPRDARQFAFQLFFHSLKDGSGFDPKHPLLSRGFAEALIASEHLPRGVVLCTCMLIDCIPTDNAAPTNQEEYLGDYGPGRFAWRLDNVQRLPDHVPARGRLGLWEWSNAST